MLVIIAYRVQFFFFFFSLPSYQRRDSVGVVQYCCTVIIRRYIRNFKIHFNENVERFFFFYTHSRDIITNRARDFD